jgi:hypothetical protein
MDENRFKVVSSFFILASNQLHAQFPAERLPFLEKLKGKLDM